MSRPQFPTTGRFSYEVKTGSWEWDEEVYRIHGLPADYLPLTTDMVLAEAEPDARERIEALLGRMVKTAKPFSVAYRLAAVDQLERTVVIVGERAVGGTGAVTVVEGYFVDLTADIHDLAEAGARAAVEASAEHRAVIEQAKGALMLAYGLDPDAAFAMLAWWSRNRNIKVRDLATRLVHTMEQGLISESSIRSTIDHLLYDISD